MTSTLVVRKLTEISIVRPASVSFTQLYVNDIDFHRARFKKGPLYGSKQTARQGFSVEYTPPQTLGLIHTSFDASVRMSRGKTFSISV
jgi:hypothetical protein